MQADPPRGPTDDEPDADGWAGVLARHWEERAASPSRDFFVASHPGWDDPVAWEATARRDAELFLHGLDADWLAGADVLEIGCGVGRLARSLCERVAGYTGVDIAPGMVAEARARCADLDTARFCVGDGLGLPAEARDRHYDLVLSVAVLIHCPREVIERLVRAGYEQLRPGGQLRLQLRADPGDPTGLGGDAVPDPSTPDGDDPAAVSPAGGGGPSAEAVAAALDAAAAQARAVEREVTEEQRALTDGVYYMGAAFGYLEARDLLAAQTGGRVQMFRLDAASLGAIVERPAGG